MGYGWEGEKIRLVPLDRDKHLENALRWFNDPDVTRWLETGDWPLTRGAEEEFFREWVRLQVERLAEVEELFAPLPVLTAPLQDDEVTGGDDELAKLQHALARVLFGDVAHLLEVGPALERAVVDADTARNAVVRTIVDGEIAQVVKTRTHHGERVRRLRAPSRPRRVLALAPQPLSRDRPPGPRHLHR